MNDPSSHRRDRGGGPRHQWLLQCRYMQIEGMGELTPPLLDPDPA